MTEKPRGTRPKDYFKDKFDIRYKPRPRVTVTTSLEDFGPYERIDKTESAAVDDVAAMIRRYQALGAIREPVTLRCGGVRRVVAP